MTFYYVQEEMGVVLKDILNKLATNNRDYLIKNTSITWINFKSNNNAKGYGFGLNNHKLIYPASIVKLVYGLAIHTWIKKGRFFLDGQIDNAVHEMLVNSSNDATSLILDLLTGTSSGASIEEDSWESWKYRRYIINDWLKELKWDELHGLNCCQKTWEDGPYGREKDFYGDNNENINLMSTDATARILEEIMRNISYSNKNVNLKSTLSRDLKNKNIPEHVNQIKGFIGEGLPNDTPFWSKAGLMSRVRHDAAWWSNNQSNHTLLVIFGNSEEHANDRLFLPEIASAIYQLNKD